MTRIIGKIFLNVNIILLMLISFAFSFNHLDEEDISGNATSTEIKKFYEDNRENVISNDDDWGEVSEACGVAEENRIDGENHFSSGVGVIRVQKSHEDYLNARKVAFKKAFLSAKRQMVESIKIQIATETAYLYSEGQSIEANNDDSANEDKNLSFIDKFQLLANAYLDDELEKKGVNKDQEETVDEDIIKASLVSEEFQQKIEAVAQSAVNGVTALEFIEEKCENDNKAVIIAKTVWSPKLRQLAAAITNGDASLSPKGIKKKPIEQQLDQFDLKNYSGVIMMYDENGIGNLVSIGHAVSVGNSNASMATEKADLEAKAKIREFMGEYLVTGKSLDQAESYQEFDDMSQSYEYNENTQISIKSESDAMILQGAKRVGKPIVIQHKASNKNLYIVAVKWSPETLTSAINAENTINDTTGTNANTDSTNLEVIDDNTSYYESSGTESAADF